MVERDRVWEKEERKIVRRKEEVWEREEEDK